MLHVRTLTLTLAAALAGGATAMATLPAAAPAQDPAMEAWMKAGTPGPQHAQLAKLAGEWTAVSEFVMQPGMPPQQSKGSCTNELIFGGRFLTQKFKGNAMGMEFEGFGVWGYDNTAKEYVSYWIDSTGTLAVISKGKDGDDPKVITVSGRYSDPINGGTKPNRNVITIHDDDSHSMEMFEQTADGKEYRTLIIKYTRVKKD